MKIQAIANYNYCVNQSKLRSTTKHQDNPNTDCKSIYSKGMSNICFGSVIPIKTSFAKEIAQQPSVLQNVIDNFLKVPGKISGIDINWSKQDLKKVPAINIVASGSSKNAGEMAKAFIEEVTQLPVNLMSASEFISFMPKMNKRSLMMFVSQSGNTADTLKALELSKKSKMKTIAITNDPKSKIHKAADVALDMQAGVENAVAATKTVTSSVVNLWGIGMKLGEIRGTFSATSKKGEQYIKALQDIPAQIESMIKNTEQVDKVANKIAGKENFYLLAKDPNLGAVNEGALKLTETTQKRIISGSSSEYMHGLFTSMKPNDVFFEVATGKKDSDMYKLAVENFQEIVKKRQPSNAILIKEANNKSVEQELNGVDFIDIPETSKEFSPLFSTIRFQQLTNSITKKLGIDPDNGGGVLTKFRQSLSM